MSDCENCKRLGKELAELRRAYGPDARERLRTLLDIAAERDRDLCAELDAANALLVRLGSGTWQTSDLALPRDVKAHLAALNQETGCECPAAHECGVTTSTAANERGQAVECCMGGKRTERWCGTPRSEADRRVLDAMAKAKLVRWSGRGGGQFAFLEDELAVCEAELARRKAAKR